MRIPSEHDILALLDDDSDIILALLDDDSDEFLALLDDSDEDEG